MGQRGVVAVPRGYRSPSIFMPNTYEPSVLQLVCYVAGMLIINIAAMRLDTISQYLARRTARWREKQRTVKAEPYIPQTRRIPRHLRNG